MNNEKVRVSLSKRYAALAKRLGTYPEELDLRRIGIPRNTYRYHFGDLETLKQFSRERHPESFKNIINLEVFNDIQFKHLQKRVKEYKTFIVQTTVGDAPIDKRLMSSVKTYLKEKKGLHLIIPADYALQTLDPAIMADEEIEVVFRPLKLNSNICVNPIKIDPKQIDPTTSLDAFGREETVIVGSPKQRRISIANSPNKLARVIQATGALTKPNYIPRDGIPKRRDTLAEKHHRMGGVIVEIVDDKFYHVRHFEMCKDGSFNDLFYNYSGMGTKYIGCEAVIQGDKHCGDTDPLVNKAVDEMCKEGNPTYRIDHDFVNGTSVNPHNKDKQIELAILAEQGRLSLKRELQDCATELKRVRKLKSAQVHVIVESNHNEWIMRYLNEGKFSPENRLVATQLQARVIQTGDNPFKLAMEMFGVEAGKDLIFLGIDDEFKRAGCALGWHGHVGANGSKGGGAQAMEKAYGKCFFGHIHYGSIYGDAMSVGTSTYLKVSYNRGASSWDNTQGILYKDGTRQLVGVIKGKWKLKNNL